MATLREYLNAKLKAKGMTVKQAKKNAGNTKVFLLLRKQDHSTTLTRMVKLWLLFLQKILKNR